MQDLPVPLVDIGVAIVLLSSGVLAYLRGFVHETLSIAGWLGAVLATMFGLPFLKPHARELIANTLIADVAAGLLIFLVSLFALSILTHAVSSRIRESALGALDRALGFLFGLARGAVIVVLAYLAAEWIWPPPPEKQPQWLTAARTAPLMASGGQLLKTLVPADAKKAEETIDEFTRETQKMLDSQKALREMLNVAPKRETDGTSGDASEGETGYGHQERLNMQRLIEGNQ